MKVSYIFDAVTMIIGSVLGIFALWFVFGGFVAAMGVILCIAGYWSWGVVFLTAYVAFISWVFSKDDPKHWYD